MRPSAPVTRAQSISEVAAAIRPASEAIGPLRMVIYGKNKQGKTWQGASSGLKTLFIECEPDGMETLAYLHKPNVDYFEVKRWEDMDKAFWFLHAGGHDYEVVVIDTISMLGTLCLRFVMGQESTLDPLMPVGKHWNKLGQLLDNEILRWVMLPLHVIFLAQERNRNIRGEDGEETLQQIQPDLTPHPLGTLLGAVGTIGRVYSKEVEQDNKKVIQYRMLLGAHGTYMAGTRVKGLPRVMVNPTLEKLLDYRAKAGESDAPLVLYPEDREASVEIEATEAIEALDDDAGFVALE